MNRNISIVLDIGYGDTGKGNVVNSLIYDPKSTIVVRFGGGHQSGHQVHITEPKDIRHVFSNFGCGTLVGAPTYWSEYCTIDPIGMIEELKVLRKKMVTPKLYINANAMITLPFDKLQNQQDRNYRKNGTIGVGFGPAIARTEDHFGVYARDILYPEILKEKIKLINENYYKTHNIIDNMDVDKFVKDCQSIITPYCTIVDSFDDIYPDYQHIIFEGHQGIMLDQKYGFFPHVTRSNTTSKNAIELLNPMFLNSIHLYYVTRSYQTRHGNGPLINSNLMLPDILYNKFETNTHNEFQGKFRKSKLDLDTMRYAINCDKYYWKKSPYDPEKYLVVTCMDQLTRPGFIPLTTNGKEIDASIEEFKEMMMTSEINKFHFIYGDNHKF